MISATLVTAVTVAAAMVAASPALAEERTCRGTIGATTVDNLRVPQDARCALKRTRVEGTVKVERGARLNARGIRVNRISITANRIDGNLQCKENSRRPRGGRNIVQGNKEDQCARL